MIVFSGFTGEVLLNWDGGGAWGEIPLSLQVRNAGEWELRSRENDDKSKMQGTHGCIHGRTYSKKNKTFPTVQVKDSVVSLEDGAIYQKSWWLRYETCFQVLNFQTDIVALKLI